MEREEPQGEETGDPIASIAHLNRIDLQRQQQQHLLSLQASVKQQQQQQQQQQVSPIYINTSSMKPPTTTRLATPTSGALIDSIAKLNPSVYSHPNISANQDPLLAMGKVEVTSSGAFFDPKAVAKKAGGGGIGKESSSSTDMIAQLTREMNAELQLRENQEKTKSLSRSQPDLHLESNATANHNAVAAAAGADQGHGHLLHGGNHQLMAENQKYKLELFELTKKIQRVGNLEQDLIKVQSAYQNLLRHSEKREQLEKAARMKLQTVIINLTEVNKEVTERHEEVMRQLMTGDPKNQNIPGLDGILRGEIMRKDALIGQLMQQNKMLMTAKERQEVELAAQIETLEEQRSHIQILDTALSNAQQQLIRLEEENKMREGYEMRVKQMTRSLEQLQAASEKREAVEKKLRAKLEEELGMYRAKKDQEVLEAGGMMDEDEREELIRKMHQMEERIIRVESERAQWEQRYLEEAAMRQVQ